MSSTAPPKKSRLKRILAYVLLATLIVDTIVSYAIALWVTIAVDVTIGLVVVLGITAKQALELGIGLGFVRKLLRDEPAPAVTASLPLEATETA